MKFEWVPLSFELQLLLGLAQTARPEPPYTAAPTNASMLLDQGQEPCFFRAERAIILAVEGIQSLRIRQWIQFGRARCNGSVMPRARNAAFVNNFWVNLRCGAVRNEEPQPMHSSSCP